MTRALVIVNRGSARAGGDLSAAFSTLERAGFTLDHRSSDSPEAIQSLIDRGGKDCDLVVLGGGDGTLNAAAGALLRSRLPLGILPLGTANDLARTLDIPSEPAAAARVIAEGRRHAIDLGRVNERYFLNVATLGLGVEVSRAHTAERKRALKIFSYVPSFLEAYKKVRPFRAEVTCDGARRTIRAVQISVGNGRYHGGGIAVSQHAEIDDQTLTVYYLKPFGLVDLLALTVFMRLGRHGDLPVAEVMRGSDIVVRTPRPMPINTDGEVTAWTPATFTIVPKALEICVPESYLTRRFGGSHAS